MKFSEKWGDSIDAAVELALLDLNLSREQVTVTVLEEPSKGFFGIGSKLAKVRVEEIPAKPAKSESSKAENTEKTVTRDGDKEICIELCGVSEGRENAPAKKSHRSSKPARGADSYAYGELKILEERPADLEEKQDHPVKSFLDETFEKMGLDVSFKLYANAESVYVDIEGPDSGTVIGKRGQTLDAIQYLSNLVANKGENNYIRVVIDAEGYRKKREITLEKLANRLADKVVRSSKSVRLEPMNPYERKVIHTALQRRPEVTTKSEGEEPYRRVVIELTK